MGNKIVNVDISCSVILLVNELGLFLLIRVLSRHDYYIYYHTV